MNTSAPVLRTGPRLKTAMRRAHLLVVAGSATGLRVNAQEVGGRSAVTVTGTVVNEVTGEPIAEVIVIAAGLGLTFVTDAQGRFAFDEVPRGVYDDGCRD